MENEELTQPEMTSPFIYKLNAMELAAQAENPAQEGYAEKRRAVLDYVAELETRIAEDDAIADRLARFARGALGR